MPSRWTLAAHLDLSNAQDITNEYTIFAETLNETDYLEDTGRGG